MNTDELIAQLATKYHKVDEAGIHQGNTVTETEGVFSLDVL